MKPTMYIIGKIQNGSLRMSQLPVMHATYEEARTEAERLTVMRTQEGWTFIIFEAKTKLTPIYKEIKTLIGVQIEE